MRNLKQGKDVVNVNGETISNAQVTYDPHPSKAYAFCSDTGYHPEMTQTNTRRRCLVSRSNFFG
jgi:ribonuclease Z